MFTFCRLYLGDKEAAKAVTSKAFTTFLYRDLPLHQDRSPVALFHCMIEAVQHVPIALPDCAQRPEFCHVLLSMPADERAVFVLHASLGLHFRCLATVTGVTQQRVQQLWTRSVVRLRHYFLHSTQDCIVGQALHCLTGPLHRSIGSSL